MKYEARNEGWWIAESLERDKHFCYSRRVRPVVVGEEVDMDRHRGPFPTKEMAEEHAWWNSLPGYWERNLAVYADHCLNCGDFAKVLAFSNSARWSWRVTECKRCGIYDSRVEGRRG